ncbi:preprotein translocase subunit SecE [Deinococcus psychrotolerans]|uniref:Protein translocase subunit SecE n=2 Tax=Deinococcus TaxID=1298 RepID=A0A553USE1_9DEIO|nr:MULTISPECIES: preprotein translocase subunit SecE [Deinococcus]AZI41690.1 preprotein translocase subunit SecE [Deinococcus psychrotolerans]TSA83139.1 preprotein translocase subunit SecE [Deinococcus detaillensis]
MNIVQYFKDAQGELSRVTWPSREAVFEGTQAVLIFVIGLTLIVFALDKVFGILIKLVLP